MKDNNLFKQIIEKIYSIKEIIEKRNWIITTDLILERGATEKEIEQIENKSNIILPNELSKLFHFSKHLEFRYMINEELPSEFKDIFSGEIYWNMNTLLQEIEFYKEWVKASLDPASNDIESINITEKIWRNKLPFMSVPNGDLIVVGCKNAEVVYLSHEGDLMHGKKLSDNLYDFLVFHSEVGFIGTEDWQFQTFYDFEKDKMVTTGEKIERFIKWLEK